ncbi:cytochrome b [Allohahella sp. A8]|uniref:cytochrome b n=1 Tax=Allohahella sp. A8 TaxID=3141461 RepID=UPI003A800668
MQLRNSEHGYGLVAVTLHWLVAITVFAMFGLGLYMVDLDYYDPWYTDAPDLHRSAGVLLFVLVILRLLWRLVNQRPAPLAGHRQFERVAAVVVHGFLYLDLFIVMVSGYLISTADGRGIEVFGLFEVPALLAAEKGREELAGLVHWYAALALVAMAGVHAAAALKHHFVDRDQTLMRMLKVTPPK